MKRNILLLSVTILLCTIACSKKDTVIEKMEEVMEVNTKLEDTPYVGVNSMSKDTPWLGNGSKLDTPYLGSNNKIDTPWLGSNQFADTPYLKSR